MYSQNEIDEAVSAGAITADAANALRAHIQGQRSLPAQDEEQFRLITGDSGEEDSIFDSARIQLNFNSSRWYFWQFTWRTGRADLVVREDGPRGRVIYNQGRGTGTHPYRPETPGVRAPLASAAQNGVVAPAARSASKSTTTCACGRNAAI